MVSLTDHGIEPPTSSPKSDDDEKVDGDGSHVDDFMQRSASGVKAVLGNVWKRVTTPTSTVRKYDG